MKRILSFASLLVAMVSCAGFHDGDDEGGAVPVAPYTLTVDKTIVESDGRDAVTFEIVDANGLVVTGPEYIRNASFNIVGTDEWVTAMGTDNKTPNVFSFIADGEYTVRAMYNGELCSNTITVTSRNRASYEVFHRNIAIYRLTATWCGFCPDMTAALSAVNDYTKEHSVVMSFHNGDAYSIYPGTAEDCAALLLKRFGTADDGLPYCIYALSEGSGDRKRKDIQDLVSRQLYDAPAGTGIKAQVSAAGDKLTVNVTVKASAPGEYDLGWAVLQDGLVPGGEANEERYDNVVRSISGNFYGMSDGKFTLGAGGEHSDVLEWSNGLVSSSASDLKVALFTLVNRNGRVVIDNIIVVKVGESADYRYNGVSQIVPGQASGYKKKSVAMEFTSVWCSNCYMLADAMEVMQDNHKDEIIPVAFHMDYDGKSDPMTHAMTGKLYNTLKTGEGIPMFALNFKKSSRHIVNEYPKMEEELSEQSASYPASCGVAIETEYEESSRNLKVKAAFRSDISAPYRYHLMLVENGVEYMQAGVEDDAYVHNHVLRVLSSDNIYGTKLNNGNSLAVGEEYVVEKSFILDPSWTDSEMRVVVAMLAGEDDAWYCNNANECAVGGCSDYCYMSNVINS